MQILQVKYQSARFGEMKIEDVEVWADALLLKINSITGWVLPEDTGLTVISDQFKKKLTESYSNCNPDEIEYAFRNYGTSIKDWGKQMNLSLIDEVMIPYLSKRAELSRLEEQKVKPIDQIENKEDMSHASMTDWFNDVAKKIKAGEMLLEFVPPMLYEFMDDNGNINKTAKEKHEYLARAVEYRYDKLIEAVQKEDNATNRYALTSFSKMRDQMCFEGDEITKLKTLAKQIILFEAVINAEPIQR
jgi:hypothetical protein